MRSLLLLLLLGATALVQSQTIVTVESAASGPLGIPASAIAPGSLVMIQQLRGGPVAVGGDLSRFGVQVRALPGGEAVAAQVLDVRLSSVLALFPKSIPPGEAEVTVSVDGQAALPVRVRVTRAAPGLFGALGAPLGPAIAQNLRPNGVVESNALLAPAVPGDYLVLWGSGLGETPPANVTVEVGGRTVVPDYAGQAPGLPGVDQINVRVPAGIPEGCYVAVRLHTPESVSNEVTIAAASGRGPCRHPLGLSEAQLRDLDANRSVRVVQANLRSEVMPPAGPAGPQPVYTRNGAASIEFALRAPLDVFLASQPLLEDDAYFSCRLQNSIAIPRFTQVDDFDGGPRIDVSGPGGKTLTATNEGVPILYVDFLEAPEAKSDPADLPAPFFSEGVWTLSGPGGRSLAPFQTELTVPPPIRLTNAAQLQSVDRSRDQVIAWSPEGYTERDVMTVFLTNRAVSQPAPAGVSANTVMCRAPAAAGQVTLPATLLQRIPPSPGLATTMAATLELRLASHPYRRKVVDLPLTNGAKERMVLDYLHSELRAVAIR